MTWLVIGIAVALVLGAAWCADYDDFNRYDKPDWDRDDD